MESRQSGNAASKLTLTCEKDFDFEYFDAVFLLTAATDTLKAIITEYLKAKRKNALIYTPGKTTERRRNLPCFAKTVIWV